MKTLFTLTFFFAAFTVIAQPGSLITEFGIGGKIATDLGSDFDIMQDLATQKDGKIVAVGYTGTPGDYDFAVVRYNPDGSLDNTFNSTGKIITRISTSSDIARAVAIQEDGKIVVSGGSRGVLCLVRYNTDGTPDKTFDHDGIAFGNLASGFSFAGNGVVILPDRKILVAGAVSNEDLDFALAKFNCDGSIDMTFGNNGNVQTSFDSGSIDRANDLAIRSDGKIVLAGTSRVSPTGIWRFAMACYNSNGTLDKAFAHGGKFVYAPANIDENLVQSIAIQPDNKIVATGLSTLYSPIPKSKVAVFRLTKDGNLDLAFNKVGSIIADFYGYGSGGYDVAIQKDNKILIAGGCLVTEADVNFFVARLNSDGSLDKTFGSKGTFIVRNPDSNEGATSMAIFENKIYLGGSSYIRTGSNDNFLLTAHHNDVYKSLLDFTFFSAIQVSDVTILSWKVNSLETVDHFDIERSTDQNSFTVIGTVKVTGNFTPRNLYIYKIRETEGAKYRIKAVEKNRKDYVYSKTLVIDVAKNILEVFPNPAKDVIHVKTSLQGNLRILIQNINGRVIQERKVTNYETTTTIPFDITSLRKGLYFVTIKGDEKSGKRAFIKL